MKHNKRSRVGARASDGGAHERGDSKYRLKNAGRPLAWVAALTLASAAISISVGTPAISQDRLVMLNPSKRTAIINIAMGKTQDVRVDGSFTDVTVGDPEVADVTPLTDHSLSILGKKIGTTRVSVYDESKHPVGLFDVEVSYDVSRLSVEINRINGGGIRVASVNGRIMLAGTALDAPTVDKAVIIARQFAPEVINAVQVLQPQQVLLEVRFVRPRAKPLANWASSGTASARTR